MVIAKMDQENINQILRDAFDAEESDDLVAAIRLFKRAARHGSNVACSKLGTIYDDVLTPPNPFKAIYWYKRAVKGHHPNGAWNLAMHYAGLGRRRGYLYWLRIAAKMGDADASVELTDNVWWEKRRAR